jgi:hypothetical protein
LTLALAFALGLAAAITVFAFLTRDGAAEKQADLNPVVVAHVRQLLTNRFDLAWDRLHPSDRATVNRALWESCKRSPDEELADVRYRSVRVVESQAVNFSSSLHENVSARAVTTEVRAVLAGVPFTTSDTSHWLLDDGRWSRMVEGPKLDAYGVGQCP